MRRSRRAAILQLKMGRLAHVIGLASGLALALTALIAYGLENWGFLREGPGLINTLKWIIPLMAGGAVAAITIAVKWEPYVADKGEPHFVMSISALVISLLFIAIIALDEVDYLLFGSPDWLYPASLLGITLTEISLAMVWEGASRRKTISIVAAVFPPLLLAFPMAYHPDPETLASILPMAYLGSAVAFQLSGSMLHIIASSTSVQQREVLKASDGKLREQMIDLDKRRKALAYREDAFRSRESDLETYEKKLMDEMAAFQEKKAQMETMESDLEQRLKTVGDARQTTSRQQASVAAEVEKLRVREAGVEAEKRELDKVSKSIIAREESIAARERDAQKTLLDAQAKDREMKNRFAEIEMGEAQLASKKKQIESEMRQLAEREKSVSSRERTLDLKALEVALAKDQLGKVTVEKNTVRALEQQLMMKQEAVAEKEMSLRTVEEEISKKSEKADRLIARADRQMNELVEKEGAILVREKAVSEKESRLKSEVESLNMRLQEMESARAVIGDREKQYEDLAISTSTKLTELESREEETERRMAALAKREVRIKELEVRLRQEQEHMNSKFRQLVEKEKDLQAEEAEVALKRAELKAMEQEILESVEEVEEARAEAPSAEEEDKWKALEMKERQLMEKERDMKSRLYQREKEIERREKTLQVHLMKDIEGMEETVLEERAQAKVKTGVERLDDLLLGGMPFGSNVMYIGPPFIGKEIAIMLFVAEGLKKGVPSIIVTTSHTPSEIAKDMAPVLPTFMEFQQLGLVRWIDATGSESNDSSIPGADANIARVSGPGDFKGITEAVEEAVKAFQKRKHPYFRVAYMSLSMSITQAEDKRSFQFVQSLAGRLKVVNAVSVFAVERGMHTEQQLESMQHHMTGAIQYKTDKQKTLLSVQGIGDVQTRAWIEYKHTNKALMVGAFSLERIR